MRTLAAVLTALVLAGCPEPAPPGYDPSNPQPLGEAARKPPPPGALPPNVPPPPPDLGKKDAQPLTAPPAGDSAAPVADDDSAATADDFSKHFAIRMGLPSSELISIAGDGKSAVTHEVRSSKNGDATLKTGQLGAKDVATLVAALQKAQWWKAPAAKEGAPRISISAGGTSHSFAMGGPVEKAIRAALASSRPEAPPPTKVLKFKAGSVNKGVVAAKGHCPDRGRPGYFTCVSDSGPWDHCAGKGHKFVCYASPFDGKGASVISDVAADEKKKPAAPEQPWGIELSNDRCIAAQGHWRCEHDSEVARVTQGKTWLAWPQEGDPVAVKAGYPE